MAEDGWTVGSVSPVSHYHPPCVENFCPASQIFILSHHTLDFERDLLQKFKEGETADKFIWCWSSSTGRVSYTYSSFLISLRSLDLTKKRIRLIASLSSEWSSVLKSLCWQTETGKGKISGFSSCYFGDDLYVWHIGIQGSSWTLQTFYSIHTLLLYECF